jgi:NSS family neurotransmitter:Na+ symporter
VPALALALLVWWLWLSAAVYAPDDWFDPVNPYSIATVLVQWGIALGLLKWMNDAMTRRL